jgi:DNA-directed RNA polymerase subunit H (RpoH/RPB5)
MNSNRVSRVFNSRVILLDQLLHIGYDTKEYLGASIEEINAMDINSQLDMIMSHTNGSTIYVHYHIGDARFSERTLSSICSNLYEPSPDDPTPTLNTNDVLMIILMDDVSESLTNHLIRIYDRYNYFVIPRSIDQLQFNILQHTLVPKHTLMCSDEVEKMIRKYHCTLEQLPTISRFDPVAKAICLRPTQVCEILRGSNNAVQSLYHRVCTNTEIKIKRSSVEGVDKV